MIIKTFALGPLGTNCYVISTESSEAVIIDPGFEAYKIIEYIQKLSLSVKYIIFTHGHYDHFAAAKKIAKVCDAKFVIYKGEDEYLKNDNLSLLSVNECLLTEKIEPDILVDESSVLTFGGNDIKFLHTPGHSKNSMCIIIADNIFTGDTLFYMTIGRTDLPGGDFNVLKDSLKKLKKLNKNYKVYPGHLQATTLDFEIKNNPYMVSYEN